MTIIQFIHWIEYNKIGAVRHSYFKIFLFLIQIKQRVNILQTIVKMASMKTENNNFHKSGKNVSNVKNDKSDKNVTNVKSAPLLQQLENYIIVDVGANLTNKKFSRDLDSVLQRAKDSGTLNNHYKEGINI